MRLRLMIVAAACLMMTGCRHKTLATPVIPPPSPVAVTGVAGPKTPPLLPTETLPSAPVATVPVVPGTPAKRVKKKVVPAPVEVANVPPPPPAPIAIGSLSAAGESNGESRRAVSELITANEKRLGGLSADVRDKQKDQIVRVRNFQAEAQKALGGGDAEGAMNMATKAKVLLDEMTN